MAAVLGILTVATLAFLVLASRAGVPDPAGFTASPRATAQGNPALVIKVDGNRLVDGQNRTVRLLGVNRSGTEYACIQGLGIFDGPHDASSISAMARWRINVVRIPLNEDCWLNINGVKQEYAGQNYEDAIVQYVNTLHQYGLYAILDLHWNAGGPLPASGQQLMADADHAGAFWSSVARVFKNDPAVLFDLYNEPHGVSWQCWLNGCTLQGEHFAGMQTLVNSVRVVGATQPILLGGNDWANDLSLWLSYEPYDSQSSLVASYHSYSFNRCTTATCWNSEVLPVAAAVPVVTGEMGEKDCQHAYVDRYMAWADSKDVSYLAWTWNTGACRWALIDDYQGTPTPYGKSLFNHLAALPPPNGYRLDITP
jgi:aryl-phospho-beta-D-glucosidase BglC (GH1 family)